MLCNYSALLAVNVVAYIEDDVCVVSFASDMSPDPEQYLILSESLWDASEDVHASDCFEILQSGVLGEIPAKVRLVELSSDEMIIHFDESSGTIGIVISYPKKFFTSLCEFMPKLVEKAAVPFNILG